MGRKKTAKTGGSAILYSKVGADGDKSVSRGEGDEEEDFLHFEENKRSNESDNEGEEDDEEVFDLAQDGSSDSESDEDSESESESDSGSSDEDSDKVRIFNLLLYVVKRGIVELKNDIYRKRNEEKLD